MNGSFIDSLEDLEITQEEADAIVDAMNADDTELIQWWQDNKMPEGLQCVEVHMFPTTRAFIEECWARRGIKGDKTRLVQCVVLLDSMIS
jgi:hypothetical protein